MKKRQSKDPLSTVSQPRRHKVAGSDDRLCNDYFEALIIAIALFGVGGGVIGMYYLSQSG